MGVDPDESVSRGDQRRQVDRPPREHPLRATIIARVAHHCGGRRWGSVEVVIDPVDPKSPPSSEDRRRAIQEHAWLTRDGEVLPDRDSVLRWLVDRGGLPEMYRPPSDS